MKKRFEQIIFIASFMIFSWLAMQIFHEHGHLLGAWLTGGEVSKLALHPLIISRTELSHNPHPLFVVWAGPIVGVLIPLVAFLVARLAKSPCIYLFRFFAGFCLVANGLYIAFGPSDGFTDSGIMLLYGSARWMLLLFGALTIPLGFYLWHKQGEHFGLGSAKGVVDRKAVVVSLILAGLTICVEVALAST